MLLFLSSMLHSESLSAVWIAVSQEWFRILKSKGNHKKFEKNVVLGLYNAVKKLFPKQWCKQLVAFFLIFDVTGINMHI